MATALVPPAGAARHHNPQCLPYMQHIEAPHCAPMPARLPAFPPACPPPTLPPPEGRAAARRTSLLARCSPLTPELAAAAASHGTLLLVAADWGMFELFGVNWLSHVQRSGVDNYLLAALDQVGGGSAGACVC